MAYLTGRRNYETGFKSRLVYFDLAWKPLTENSVKTSASARASIFHRLKPRFARHTLKFSETKIFSECLFEIGLPKSDRHYKSEMRRLRNYLERGKYYIEVFRSLSGEKIRYRNILDVGCGVGGLTIRAKDFGAFVVGIDLELGRLKVIKRALG